jgi:hypothetical protein
VLLFGAAYWQPKPIEVPRTRVEAGRSLREFVQEKPGTGIPGIHLLMLAPPVLALSLLSKLLNF